MTTTMLILLFLLMLSIFLIIVEIFFIPGTTIFGIVGGIGAAISIYFSFLENNRYGYISIFIALVLFLIFFLIGKKMMDKSKFNLKESLTEKVNTNYEGLVAIGDEGICLSVLKPNGKALIDGKKVEVYSLSNYIEKDTEVKVIKIQENKIFVHPLT